MLGVKNEKFRRGNYNNSSVTSTIWYGGEKMVLKGRTRSGNVFFVTVKIKMELHQIQLSYKHNSRSFSNLVQG